MWPACWMMLAQGSVASSRSAVTAGRGASGRAPCNSRIHPVRPRRNCGYWLYPAEYGQFGTHRIPQEKTQLAVRAEIVTTS